MKLNFSKNSQVGASLIEVLVAILILSFGMLALANMMSFGVQLPKLSGYRATATTFGLAQIEQIRANPYGFSGNNYSSPLNYDGTFASIAAADCAFPNCTIASLAVMDIATTQARVRQSLPAGGMIMKCDTPVCSWSSYGNLWIVWQEPSTFAAILPTSSDNCPVEVTSVYTSPSPRCLYLRFKL